MDRTDGFFSRAASFPASRLPLPAMYLHFAVGALLLSIAAGLSIRLPSAYAPYPALCPSTPLVRPANGLSTSEAAYISSRKTNANQGLAAWLTKTNAGFGTTKLPTVALTTSGGGYRSLLSGAGVIQAFDSRDSNVGTSGLFQG